MKVAHVSVSEVLPKGGLGFVVSVAYDRVGAISGLLRDCLDFRRAFCE